MRDASEKVLEGTSKSLDTPQEKVKFVSDISLLWFCPYVLSSAHKKTACTLPPLQVSHWTLHLTLILWLVCLLQMQKKDDWRRASGIKLWCNACNAQNARSRVRKHVFGKVGTKELFNNVIRS